MLRQFQRAGVEELSGHELYAMCEEEYAAADAWLERGRLRADLERRRGRLAEEADRRASTPRSTRSSTSSSTSGRQEADVMHLRRGGRPTSSPSARSEGDQSGDDGGGVARLRGAGAALQGAREGAVHGRRRHLGLRARQDARRLLPGARRHRLRHRQVARGRAVRRHPLDGDEDRRPRTTRRCSPTRSTPSFPDKMLAYNLSPSFNWDTTGMNDDADARASPRSSGRWASSSTSSPTADTRSTASPSEEFATALRQDGMLALARAAAEVPPARVALPHAADARRRAARRRGAHVPLRPHRHDQGDGQGLDAAPAPRADRGAAQAARGVARALAQAARASRASSRSRSGRTAPAPTLLELSASSTDGEKS